MTLPEARQRVDDALPRDAPGLIENGGVALRIENDPEDNAAFQVWITAPTQYQAQIRLIVRTALAREKVTFM